MNKYKKNIVILTASFLLIIYFLRKNGQVISTKSSTIIKKTDKKGHRHNHKAHHKHEQDKKHQHEKIVKKVSHKEKMRQEKLNLKFEKQIKNYKKTSLRHLSSQIETEITVKKELSNKLILLVRTVGKDSLAQSFESIVDKQTGKVIINQGFTINENARQPRFSPSGEKVNQ